MKNICKIMVGTTIALIGMGLLLVGCIVHDKGKEKNNDIQPNNKPSEKDLKESLEIIELINKIYEL